MKTMVPSHDPLSGQLVNLVATKIVFSMTGSRRENEMAPLHQWLLTVSVDEDICLPGRETACCLICRAAAWNVGGAKRHPLKTTSHQALKILLESCWRYCAISDHFCQRWISYLKKKEVESAQSYMLLE